MSDVTNIQQPDAAPTPPSVSEPNTVEVVQLPTGIGEFAPDVPDLPGAAPAGEPSPPVPPPEPVPPAAPAPAPVNPFLAPPGPVPPSQPMPLPQPPAQPAENMNPEIDPVAFASDPTKEIARTIKVQARLEAQRIVAERDAQVIAGRAMESFTHGSKHYESVIAPHPAMKDPRVASTVNGLVKLAQENALYDPRQAEAFRDPGFFQDVVNMAIRRVGWHPATSVATTATALLSSSGGQAAPSTASGPLTAEEHQIAAAWGLTDAEYAKNKAQAPKGF